MKYCTKEVSFEQKGNIYEVFKVYKPVHLEILLNVRYLYYFSNIFREYWYFSYSVLYQGKLYDFGIYYQSIIWNEFLIYFHEKKIMKISSSSFFLNVRLNYIFQYIFDLCAILILGTKNHPEIL